MNNIRQAAKNANLREIKEFLAQGVDINEQKFGKAALHHACEEGHEEIVKFLLENGANVNLQSEKGLWRYTSLHLACKAGHEAIVDLLIQHGADLSIQDGLFRTSFQISCFYGQAKVATKLIDAGAEVDVKLDPDGKICIDRKITKQGPAAVKEWLSNEANVKSDDAGEEEDGDAAEDVPATSSAPKKKSKCTIL
mmetsp:Transcript_541/g.1260  ORF Transcript_541/g.1260 Transcript_541/m.1260 type:complete len:195 (-) Transcript_541:44-628(-)